jgi:hypothetical protein
MLSLNMHTLSIPFKFVEIHFNGLNPARSHDCKAIITVALYGQILSSFTMTADDSEKPVCSARCLSEFCGVCYNRAPISSSFSLVSTQHFVEGFLYRSVPVNLTFVISS